MGFQWDQTFNALQFFYLILPLKSNFVSCYNEKVLIARDHIADR